MTTSLWKPLFLSFLFGGLGNAQTAPAPAPFSVLQLSPQATYDQVMRPLEITRRSTANWSESELQALKIAVDRAAGACALRTPEQFSGDDLIAYARLCSVGQLWPIVGAAATRYITSTDTEKPHLAEAYAYQVNATLHGKDPKAILDSSVAMLHAVPYNALTDETMNAALHYLQLAFSSEARSLYATRQPIVLKTMREPPSATPMTNPETAPVPLHSLYADGIAFAACEQFNGDPKGAEGIITELDAALPAALQPDDSIPIAATRQQYALLGTPLPPIPLTVSLYSAGETPRINTDYGSSTVLLLFPDWCAQCVRMAGKILPTMRRLNENEYNVHLYGLLAQPAPPAAAPLKPANAKLPTTGPPEPDAAKTPAEELRHTPTMIVPPATLTQFAATDFPLLIATDPKGIIRFIQPAGENALNEGDFLDQIVMRINRQWPRETASKAVAAPPAHQP